MKDLYDVIIIGSGPAGMSAAVYAARANMSVLLIDKLAPGGQIIHTDIIQNYTGFKQIHGADLAIAMYEHTQSLGVEFVYKSVKDIKQQQGQHIVYCQEDACVYHAKALILCTGTKPRMLGVENERRYAGNGISWCAICDGAQYRNKNVVVIGGGNSAVEESIYLAGIVASLTIVTQFDLTADPIACDKLRKMENVSIYTYQDVLGFYGDEKIRGIRFCSTKTKQPNDIVCDGVFEYIGLIPVNDCFKNLHIVNAMGYIEVDEHMATCIPGLYGAGDCIAKNMRQVITACADGAIAAQAASHYVESMM